MYRGEYEEYSVGKIIDKDDILTLAKFINANKNADIEIDSDISGLIITVYGNAKDFKNFEKIWWEE